MIRTRTKALAALACTGLLFLYLAGSSRNISDHPLFGRAVAGVGDVDLDGTPDLIVGDRGMRGEERGRAWVVSGNGGRTLHTAVGESEGDGFGSVVGAAGDVDADGHPDWIVGAVDSERNPRGYAVVYSGSTGRELHCFVGPSSDGRFGSRVGAAGDLDRDGHGDLLVGARQGDGRAGYAFLFSGASGELLFALGRGLADGHWLSDAACVGDVNGDGLEDLALSLSDVDGGPEGMLVVYSGANASVLTELRPGGLEVSAVEGAGDIDGDGLADVVVKSRGRGLLVLRGGHWTELASVPSPAGGWYSRSLTVPGDLDGDGISEVVGGDDSLLGGGKLYAFSLANGDLLYEFVEDQGRWHFGIEVDALGDVDGDGVSDLIVGMDGRYSKANGSACVHSGRTGERLFELIRIGPWLMKL